MRIIFRQTAIRGIAVAPSRAFERMNDFLDQHTIKSVIDKVYGFDQAREAYEHLGRCAFGRSLSRSVRPKDSVRPRPGTIRLVAVLFPFEGTLGGG